MPNPNYDRKKVRKAMLLAPAVAVLGLVPFVVQLNLTFVQILLIALVALVVSYLLGTLFGSPGYLILKRLGYSETRYLMAYAVLLVILTPLILGDIYAVLTFGPPTLLAAGAFCFIRGPAVESEALA
jgi:hypothetical protein